MAKSFTFSDIDIIDDGTNLIIKAGSTELLSINKSSGLYNTPVNVDSSGISTSGDFSGGGVSVSGSELWCGTTMYLHFEPIAAELTIGTPVIVPELKITNQSGAEICGTGVISGGSVTINTTAVTSNSIVILTATHSSTATNLYLNSINDGVSFDVAGNDGNFNWFIINPV